MLLKLDESDQLPELVETIVLAVRTLFMCLQIFLEFQWQDWNVEIWSNNIHCVEIEGITIMIIIGINRGIINNIIIFVY